MARRVLVGLDRAAEAEEALRAAVALARRDHAQILVVLLERSSPLAGFAALGSCGAAEALRLAEQDRLAELRAAVHALPGDVSVCFTVRPGPMRRALARAAVELCCDAIIAPPSRFDRLRRALAARGGRDERYEPATLTGYSTT